jgi:uncharacterized membrane protein
MKKDLALRSAIAGIIALGVVGTSGSVFGEMGKMGMKHDGMEKCYGVGKAGMNDCKSGMHDCKGYATKDGDKASFIMVPKGTCVKIVGGSTKSA